MLMNTKRGINRMNTESRSRFIFHFIHCSFVTIQASAWILFHFKFKFLMNINPTSIGPHASAYDCHQLHSRAIPYKVCIAKLNSTCQLINDSFLDGHCLHSWSWTPSFCNATLRHSQRRTRRSTRGHSWYHTAQAYRHTRLCERHRDPFTGLLP